MEIKYLFPLISGAGRPLLCAYKVGRSASLGTSPLQLQKVQLRRTAPYILRPLSV